MKNLKWLFSIAFCFFAVGCGGGTETGPDKNSAPTETGPDMHGDENDKAIALFSAKEGIKDSQWLDTAADNSLAPTDFMKYVDESGPLIYGTEVFGQSNQHSHFVGLGSNGWRNYEFTGKFAFNDNFGAVGVTFYSSYPRGNSYYRIRRYYTSYNPSTVNVALSSHDEATSTSLSGSQFCVQSPERKIDSGLTPQVNSWYQFKIKVESSETENRILAKVWSDGEPEPADWSINCRDIRETRPRSGTAGIWTGIRDNGSIRDGGAKFFSDFKILLAE